MTPAPKSLYFGVAGIPNSCAGNSSLQAIDCVHSAGLEALELEFVHGLNMSRETAEQIKIKSKTYQLRISAHAPYFINLNADDRGKRIQSQDLLLNSLRLASAAGASDLVFHAGYYGKNSPEETYNNIKTRLIEIVSLARAEKLPASLRIETMGKKSQFGSLDEIINICRDIEGLSPCLDFAHIFAREGRVNSYHDFYRVLRKVEKKLGQSALKRAHIHISGVKFNQSGELKHLNLTESDFRFDEWLQTLIDFEVQGTVICESPSLEAEARILKNLYFSLKEKKSNYLPSD